MSDRTKPTGLLDELHRRANKLRMTPDDERMTSDDERKGQIPTIDIDINPLGFELSID